MRQHIIKRLTFRLNFPTRAQARQLEHEVIHICRQRLEQILDECFSELAGSDTEYHIDLLELDLGKIKPENLRTEMPSRFAEQIRKHAADGLGRADHVISDQEKQFALFDHFIETGRLPWWAGRVDKQSLERLVEKLCVNSPEPLRAMIPGVLRDGIKIRRLVNQLSDECLSRICRLYLSGRDVDFILQQLRDTDALFSELDRQENVHGIHQSRRLAAADRAGRLSAPGPVPGRIKLREHYWRHVLFGLACGPAGGFSSATLLHETLASLTADNIDVYRRLLAGLAAAAGSLAQRHYRFSTDLPGLIEKSISVVAAEPEKIVSLPVKPGRSSGRVLTKDTQKEAAAEHHPVKKTFTDTDEDYIHNAGLVILWPYLPRLFLNLGLADENDFIDADAAGHAALLLQYLVESEAEIPESLLSLNKVLCGLELNRPLAAEFTPTEKEVSECGALLDAARQHWGAIQTMADERFKAEFLQRQGILSPCAGNWQLHVENRAHDVLMQKLPWPIGVVKLPWMDYTLLVHWG